ncbi:MAG: hypothetical protein QOF98_2252 [Streptomyces sp.]|nr:hypothetical protein [Streptomyces sp.]
MRSAQDSAGGSGTPIYDALYSEYRRLFRTLPGDRSGEEQMQFSGFSAWHPPHQQVGYGGRHRGYDGPAPAALPPGRGDNRMR